MRRESELIVISVSPHRRIANQFRRSNKILRNCLPKFGTKKVLRLNRRMITAARGLVTAYPARSAIYIRAFKMLLGQGMQVVINVLFGSPTHGFASS